MGGKQEARRDTKEGEPAKVQPRVSAVYDNSTLSWLTRGEAKIVIFSRVGRGKPVYLGDASSTYDGTKKGKKFSEQEVRKISEGFSRVAETVANDAFGVRTIDCLTNSGTHPTIHVSLFGRNAGDPNSLLLYFIREKIEGYDAILKLGATRIGERRGFESQFLANGYKSKGIRQIH